MESLFQANTDQEVDSLPSPTQMQRLATVPSILGPTTSAVAPAPGHWRRKALDLSLRSVPGRATGVARAQGLTSCPQALMSGREAPLPPWYMSLPGEQACSPFACCSAHQGEEESDIVTHFLFLGRLNKDVHLKNSDFMLSQAHILEDPGFS